MENRALVIAFGLALTAACSPVTAPGDTETTDTSLHCDTVSGLCFRVDAVGTTCRAQAWVGRSRYGDCPQGVDGNRGRWSLRQEATARAEEAYCRYEWSSASTDAPDATALTALSETGDFSDFEPDCEVVQASAGTIDFTWPELQRAFFEQTERVDVLPSGDRPPAPVRVEIIDSAVTRRAADGEPSFGRLAHGRAMGLIVRRLACPAGGDSCRAKIASTLALPLVAQPYGVSRDPELGGYFGSMTDLAVAINEAIDDWQETATDHRLVVNLSLGWEPTYGGAFETDPRELSAPVRAVWNAVARARCLGAAVIAAAGNRPEGPENPEGALFPAAWASYGVPSVKFCHALGVTTLPEDYSTDSPLVFAVGGVESNDADLALGRVASRPALVAPAAHAVVADGAKAGASVIQTGTSVATAVASAAAAVVWSYRPELSAEAVMNIVYEGGAETGRPTMVCRGEDCDRTSHRVSMCGAVQEACNDGQGRCPQLAPQCDRRPGGRIARPKNMRDTSGFAISARTLAPRTTVGWPCEGRLHAVPGATVENPCPASQIRAVARKGAVGPQPDAPTPCPHCDYDELLSVLHIEIDPDVDSTLTNPVLAVVVDSDSSKVDYYDLSPHVPALTGGDKTTISDLDIGEDFESATLEFVVDGKASTRNPVIVW